MTTVIVEAYETMSCDTFSNTRVFSMRCICIFVSVEVLQEISHPFIVKLLQKIEVKAEQEKESSPEASPYCMVLSYCRGPTLEQSLKHGGACGIYLAREISAQLIDAVSFLHGRGVIHRDIKPDNISKID